MNPEQDCQTRPFLKLGRISYRFNTLALVRRTLGDVDMKGGKGDGSNIFLDEPFHDAARAYRHYKTGAGKVRPAPAFSS